jgi:methylated-DNA-protein-cysteine methyltransferase-like protein
VDDRLVFEILSVVEEIPEGKVATYGQIAALIGREKNSRLVGKVMSMAGQYGQYPCHRVVNHAGRLVPGWGEQESLLLQEGVLLKENGCVDLKKYQWQMFEDNQK